MKTRVAKPKLTLGAVIAVPFPFFVEEHGDEDLRWRPGVRFVDVDDGFIRKAHGMGQMMLTPYGEVAGRGGRALVVYGRAWRDPEGVEGGSMKYRVCTRKTFDQLCAGYRHEFEVVENPWF